MQSQIESSKAHFKTNPKHTEFKLKNTLAFSTFVQYDKYKDLAEGLLRVYNENEDLFYKYMKETEMLKCYDNNVDSQILYHTGPEQMLRNSTLLLAQLRIQICRKLVLKYKLPNVPLQTLIHTLMVWLLQNKTWL